MHLAPGTRAGVYELGAPLGAGGMAKSTAPATRGCRATSRSRCCRTNSRPISIDSPRWA